MHRPFANYPDFQTYSGAILVGNNVPERTGNTVSLALSYHECSSYGNKPEFVGQAQQAMATEERMGVAKCSP